MESRGLFLIQGQHNAVKAATTADAVEVPVSVVTPRDVIDFVDEPADVTEFDATDSLNDYSRVPNPLWHPLRFLWWTARSLFGIATLILLLAVVAAIPVAGLFVLGYLLEVEGRVARTGKLRFAFPLLNRAPRLGALAAGIGLWTLPLFFLSSMAADARLIDAGSSAAANWQAAKVVVACLIAAHLCLALARGGSFGCFFRPLKNVLWLIAELKNKPLTKKLRCPHCGESLLPTDEFCTLCHRFAHAKEVMNSDDGSSMSEPNVDQNTYWHRADLKVRQYLEDFRFRHYFLLGWRGFAGAFLLLILPTLLFASATSTEGFPVLVTVLGGVILAVVFLYIPFLQANVAVENRMSAIGELRKVRRLFCFAPIAWFIALLFVYALALPFYLFTILAAPQDVLWLITIVFVVSVYPARVLTGWAYGRAMKKERENRRAWWGFRWASRVLMLATTTLFTFLFFFTRDISSHGRLVLFEHHAFLGTGLSSIFSLFP